MKYPDDGHRDEHGELIVATEARRPVVPAADAHPGKLAWYVIERDELEWIEPGEYIERSERHTRSMIQAIALRDDIIRELIGRAAGNREDPKYTERFWALLDEFDIQNQRAKAAAAVPADTMLRYPAHH